MDESFIIYAVSLTYWRCRKLFFTQSEWLFNLRKDIFVELILPKWLSLQTNHTQGIINTKSLISTLQARSISRRSSALQQEYGRIISSMRQFAVTFRKTISILMRSVFSLLPKNTRALRRRGFQGNQAS